MNSVCFSVTNLMWESDSICSLRTEEVQLDLRINGGRDQFGQKLHKSNLIQIKCTKCCRTVCYCLFNWMYYQKGIQEARTTPASLASQDVVKKAEKMMYFSAQVSEYFTQVISCGAYDEHWSFAASLWIKKKKMSQRSCYEPEDCELHVLRHLSSVKLSHICCEWVFFF